MRAANTLQLPRQQIPEVDHDLASRVIQPLPGRFYAIESPFPESVGRILLADESQADIAADIVTVIAVGFGVDLKPGQRILVRPTHGDWIEGAVFGNYKAERRIRIYGSAVEDDTNELVRVAWDESAPVICHGKELMNLEATGRNIIIRRDAIIRSQSGIILPDDATYRSCMATVVSVGSQVQFVKPGERVHYNPLGLLNFAFGEDPDLAVVSELGINAVIGEAA